MRLRVPHLVLDSISLLALTACVEIEPVAPPTSEPSSSPMPVRTSGASGPSQATPSPSPAPTVVISAPSIFRTEGSTFPDGTYFTRNAVPAPQVASQRPLLAD